MKITQQFCLEEDNYFFLLDEMRYRKRKNLSRTLNELLFNYRQMLRALEKKQKEIEKVTAQKEDAIDTVRAYKIQLKADVNKDKINADAKMNKIKSGKVLKDES